MTYFAPETLDDALAHLDTTAMSIVAGGTDFFSSMGSAPLVILDVSRISGLRGVSQDIASWRIGAATTWTDVINADLPAAFDGLKQAAREVGSQQIQNTGTVAGNLVNASPAADGVPPLLTLDAQVELASVRGARILPLSEFITGVRQTALQAGEMVTAILIPPQPDHARARFSKLGSRKYLVISTAMVAAVIARDAQGRIDHARVAVGACSPVAQRLPVLEADLIGTTTDVQITAAHLSPLAPINDVRGSGEYRLDAAAELIRRTISGASA
ncbi:FAD binding domain-containing protein [Profundibacter amoris]|uniref:Xanthine dehydrogenase family protein subunit M n=1 Tax=Profundibacter amoris TaxID=2171755 RepID=A0A347UKU3_9RHOB|nr:FAD binding domain-containing protein [Profundibacter amoris]AXX99471.1 xanthine dehydrogenase family protein subunit M [Profundibacter amoris]